MDEEKKKVVAAGLATVGVGCIVAASAIAGGPATLTAVGGLLTALGTVGKSL